MKQAQLDCLDLAIEHVTDRAQWNAMQSLLAPTPHHAARLKRRALGLWTERQQLLAKADRLSEVLYGRCWCCAKTFGSDQVKRRREYELGQLRQHGSLPPPHQAADHG